ncbi:sensor histidine kinase [Psychrobacter sp. I-STPA6b]|uniref:sensor histidine kinase n=1 Tax=Psychrobacter sp. I-STPA6b TaxID=2585718 RepID=UPI001D0C246A|nr:ATP-binding protein [Psychrobacter sp. I-STPA6b]
MINIIKSLKISLLSRLSLFWRMFFSLLLQLLIISTLSVIAERFLNAHEIANHMSAQIDQLIVKRQQVQKNLETGDLYAIRQLYAQDPKLMRQIQITDKQGKILFTTTHKIDEQGVIIFPKYHDDENKYTVPNNDAHTPTDNKPPKLFSIYHHPLFNTIFNTNDNYAKLADTQVKGADGNIYTIQLQPELSFIEILALQRNSLKARIIIVIILATLVSLWLSRIWTRRIQRVQNSVHRMMAGDYQVDTQLMQLGNDEFGQLAQHIAQLSERLADSELARKQMLSDISHELRSPLARLEIATELTRDFSPNAGKYLDRIQKETARMNELIEHIIHIQSLQMQRYAMSQDEQQAVDLVEIINQIGQDVCFEFQDKQIHWQWQSPILQKTHKTHNPKDFIVMGHAEQLHSALENVIRNAFMHTPIGGSVQVTMTLTTALTTAMAQTLSPQKPSAIVISISDTGEGVAEKDLQRIFQPFVRLDTARHRKTGGYGLGLAIVHAVVMAHHGQIRAYNRTDTQGLTVEIELPVRGIAKGNKGE